MYWLIRAHNNSQKWLADNSVGGQNAHLITELAITGLHQPWLSIEVIT